MTSLVGERVEGERGARRTVQMEAAAERLSQEGANRAERESDKEIEGGGSSGGRRAFAADAVAEVDYVDIGEDDGEGS